MLLVLVALGIADTAYGYEGEHFAWTYYVAINCGFSERQAYQIASAAMAIDFDEQTAPLPGALGVATSALGEPPAHLPPIWRGFHAFTPRELRGNAQAVENFKQQQLNRLIAVGLQDRNPGAALHFTQDYVPHFGWDDWRGHGPAGHLPDFISSESTGPATATERTIQVLRQFGSARQLALTCKDTRLDEVLQRLVAAHETPFGMRDRIDVYRARYYYIFFSATGDSLLQPTGFATKAARLLGEFGLTPSSLDVAPSLGSSLAVVRAAVQQDRESGRLETYVDPTKGLDIPATWLVFDYDDQGHVRQDPRYPVEQPEFKVGDPSAAYSLQGEGPDATVKVSWSVPFSLNGLAQLRFLDDLPIELVSNNLPVARLDLERGNGDHVFQGDVVVPRSRVDQQQRVQFEVSAYGISTETVTLVLKADLPEAKPRHETAEFTTALAELELTAAAASLETGTSSDSLVEQAAAALDRAQAAAEEIGLLGNASTLAKEKACSGGPLHPTIESQTRDQLQQVRDAVEDLRSLAQPTDQTPIKTERRQRVESALATVSTLFDLANQTFASIDTARNDNDTLLGLRGRGFQLFDQVQNSLQLESSENPTADLGDFFARAAAAQSTIRSAMENSAGCEGDLWTEVTALLARSQQAESQLQQLLALLPAASANGSSTVSPSISSDLRSAEAYLGAAELVAESILNRMADARACAANPRPESETSGSDTSSWQTGTQETDRAGAGWTDGEQEPECRTPDATLQAIRAQLDRLQAALGKSDRFSEERSATLALVGFSGDASLCPIDRGRLADALRSVDRAQRQAGEDAKEAMEAANAKTSRRRARRSQAFASAAQTLIALSASLGEPHQTGPPSGGGTSSGATDSQGTSTPSGSATVPGPAASTRECEALQQRLMRAVTNWQQHSVRPPQDRDAVWCQQTLAMSRDFGSLLEQAERQGCSQFQSASDRSTLRTWQQGMSRATCSEGP